VCTWAKLKNRFTGEIYVHVNSHFDHISEEARVAGAGIVSRFIAENFADVPVVFTADMNAQEQSDTYGIMTADLKDARYAAADAVSYGTFHGCSPETYADYTIDYVLCSPDIRVQTYRVVTKGVDGRFTSDHFPLYADLVLSAPCGDAPAETASRFGC
jgi:endonuclease/exonuclease/phosphatase family metal-dependent hydrolase